MADPATAFAAAVAEVLGQGRQAQKTAPPVRSHQATSSAMALSIPREVLEASNQQPGAGRFYVIRASEHQPAAAVGHFVRVVSGPHDGYEAAVASVSSKPSLDPAPAGEAEHGGVPGASKRSGQPPTYTGGSVNEQLSQLLRQGYTGNGILAGFPVQLQEGGHCSESDTTQVLKRLLQQGGRDGPSRKCEAQQVACQDQEIVFLPLDTPVWHLSEKSTGDSALMVTRAENVEWMRMVWGKMTDESAILEAITRHKKEEEIRRKQAEAELQRKRQEEERQQLQRQEQQQLGMIDQVLRALGGVSSSQKQPSGSGPGILQLLEAAHRKQQHVIPEAPTSANSHNLQALVSQLLGTQNLHPAPPPQQQVPMVDFSAVQRELELAMSKQQQLALGLQGTQQNAQGFAHRRNTSLENIGIMDIGPLPVHCGGSAQRNVFDAAHGPNNPPVSKPGTVQASLTPGTLPPGPGPFYVVTADSRIQLTGTGFYLPVASGPHHGFEEALAAMTIAANHRAPMWKDAQMVHMTSDTPIWHSLELANCRYPNMIVRASDLLEPPRFEEEPETSSFPELPAGNPGTSGGTGFAELLAGISAPPSLLLPSFSSGAQPQKTRSMEMPPPPPPTLTTNRASSPAPSVDDAADGLAAAGTSMASQQDLPMETGAKRSTGRASLFPNKKAHILGRQQSMSPDVDNEAAKDEEEDTNEKACEGFDGEAVNRAAIAVAGKPASPSHEGGGSPIVQG